MKSRGLKIHQRFGWTVVFVLFTLNILFGQTTVYLIGDSTMAEKQPEARPETGWGMPFSKFFDSTVNVENRAKNGRSTRSFLAENLWQPVVDKLKSGDYVFIQFGHNDESKEKADRYTTPEQFFNNLVLFVTETRNKQAIPILLTPVARRQFDSSGKVIDTHGEYSALVRDVARQFNVILIDLDKRSQQLLEELGPEKSKALYLHLNKGEHPNYPQGKEDNTHFSEIGAEKIARILLDELRILNVELAHKAINN